MLFIRCTALYRTSIINCGQQQMCTSQLNVAVATATRASCVHHSYKHNSPAVGPINPIPCKTVARSPWIIALAKRLNRERELACIFTHNIHKRDLCWNVHAAACLLNPLPVSCRIDGEIDIGTDIAKYARHVMGTSTLVITSIACTLSLTHSLSLSIAQCHTKLNLFSGIQGW